MTEDLEYLTKLYSKIEFLQERDKNSLERVKVMTETLAKTKIEIEQIQARVIELEAERCEQNYWERQWRNEAKAREWAEGKLYQKENGDGLRKRPA
jgi:hypothetical protein